jgi:DNA-binding SARP family transcriptional activator/TolB-like protein
VRNVAMNSDTGWTKHAPRSPSDPSEQRLTLRLIGPMTAWTPTREFVLPKSRKGRALLAVLALSETTRVLRHTLADLLWHRRPEEHSRSSLRQEIHRLAAAMSIGDSGDALIIDRDHLVLRAGAVWTDAGEVMRSTISQPDALSLMDGNLLEGLDGLTAPFDLWLSSQRERLRDHARTIAEGLLSTETPDAAIASARQLLSIDRVHEGACRLLMRAYAERGEKGLAVEAYERLRDALGKLRGSEPSSETAALLGDIRGSASIEVLHHGEVPRPQAAVAVEIPPLTRVREASADLIKLGGPVDRKPKSVNRCPRIGVLPLRWTGVSEGLPEIAAGIAEDITGALSRLRWLFVVSSTTLGQYAPAKTPETVVRVTPGVDLLIDGTIRREGHRLRLTLRLIDLREDNRVVWARHFERTAGDVLTLQDEVVAAAVAQLDSEILMLEARRTQTCRIETATAHELVFRSLPLINRLERGPFTDGGTYLARAIDLEPDCVPAHAWYAYWHLFMVGQGWSDDPNSMMLKAGLLAERAITLDPYDARALTIAGHVRAFLQRRLHEAAALHARAISLNPNLAIAWALSAVTYAYMGDTDEAESRASRSKTLSPLDPHAFMFEGSRVLIDVLKGDYESAVVAGRATTQMTPSLSASFKPYVAALGHLGRIEEASVARRRLLAIDPTFTIDRFMSETPLERESDRLKFAEGLRLAGVPQNLVSDQCQ